MAGDSKQVQPTSRSRQDLEGTRSVSIGSSSPSFKDSSDQPSSSDFAVVHSLVHDIMTKAASEAKGVAAETKEAEKLAASAAKSPKPKDEVALKKGDAGKNAGIHLWVAVEPDLVGFRFVWRSYVYFHPRSTCTLHERMALNPCGAPSYKTPSRWATLVRL